MSDKISNVLPVAVVITAAQVGDALSDGVMSDLFRVSTVLGCAWIFGVFLVIALHSLDERNFSEKATTDEGEIKEKPKSSRQLSRIERRSGRASAALRRR